MRGCRTGGLRAQGQWSKVADCPGGAVCYEDACCTPECDASDCGGTDGCGGACDCVPEPECGAPGSVGMSGKRFWFLDSDEIDSMESVGPAVLVTNVSDAAATVTLFRHTGSAVVVEEIRVIPPGSLEVIPFQPSALVQAGQSWQGRLLEATEPIVATLLSGTDNWDAYSLDATPLFPESRLGLAHFVVTRPQLYGGELGSFRGTITVIATTAGTQVTVEVTDATEAGAGLPGLSAGGSQTVTLGAFEVLHLRSSATGGDLTGSAVSATAPVAVFAGHEAAVSSDKCCADHLLHQVPPATALGQTYVCARSETRGLEKDYWRIVATQDGTSLSMLPATNDVPGSGSLDRGQWLEIVSGSDFVVQASAPVLVAQVLASSQEVAGPPGCVSDAECAPGFTCDPFFGGCAAAPFGSCDNDSDCAPHTSCVQVQGTKSCYVHGDPSLTIWPPFEQFTTHAVVGLPQHVAEDYLTVVGPTGAVVQVDGTTLSAGLFQAIGASGFKAARLKVSDGVHSVTADAPVGVVAYGYGPDMSYGFAAGQSVCDLSAE